MYKRIGEYLQLVDKRNSDMQVEKERLLGININKEFMPSVANVTESNLPKYKIIEKGQFAYSAMQVGRDETIRVVLFTEDEPAIISPAYQVFEVIDEERLYPEFLMMWFHRPESDRYGWFISDSSVRASLEWERFCEIEIPIPSPDQQKKYVDIYQGLVNNQKAYESSLDDLQLICDTYIQDLINKLELEELGEYIEQVDNRNEDGLIDNLLGISVEKKFIPSRSNKERLNLKKYKIVEARQFGYVTVTSRNGGKISIALLQGETGLLSSTYQVFRVKDEKKLLPEFLFIFFQREEFDRYARFNSWGSARETFDWDEMCRVKIPVPKIEVQEAIVTIYHTLRIRKKINKQLNNIMRPLCPVLMRGVVEELNQGNYEYAN